MPGVLKETLKFTRLAEATSRTVIEVLLNDATAGAGIDTRDFDQAEIIIDAGVFSSSATIAFSINEFATDTAASSTAVSGGAIVTVTSANDQQNHLAYLDTKGLARFIWLKADKTTNTDAAVYGAQIVLGAADKNPQSNSEAISV